MRLLFCLLLFSGPLVFAQNAPAPCSAPESHQFDFWVGSWDALYGDTAHAANVITKDLNGCVLHEHFSDPSRNYHGESWSVYNPGTKHWQQTWVDDGGGYIPLTGSFEGGKMTLTAPARPYKDGKMIQSRMVYQNITAKSFDWVWEATTDEGKTWTPNWSIHYTRKK